MIWKYLYGAFSFSFVLVLLLLPNSSSGANFSSVDSFESYDTGTLVGGAGGSGWSGNWNTGGTVVSSPTNSGSRAINAGTGTAKRSMTAASDGTMTMWIRTGNTTDAGAIYIYSASSRVVLLSFCNPSGLVFKVYTNSGYVEVPGTCSIDTWYKVTLDLDSTNQANKFRLQINDNTTTGWVTSGETSTFTSLDSIWLLGSDWGSKYYDDISFIAPVTPTSTATTTIWLGDLYALVMTRMLTMLIVLSMFLTIGFMLMKKLLP